MKEEKTTIYKCECHNRKFDSKEEVLQHEKENKKEHERDNLLAFELKEEHIKLLTNMYVGWSDCEFGAPEINPKRPYGDSDGVNDVAEVLEIKKIKGNVDGYDEEEAKERLEEYGEEGIEEYLSELDWDDKTYNYLRDIHRETEIALQIVLKTKSFEIGTYEREDNYGNNWKLKKKESK